MAAILDLLNIAWTRFSTNLRGTLDGMSTEKWIRLVIIVGAYCLLRPYLMKLAGNSQMKQHDTRPEDEWLGPKAKVQPNTLRGQVEIPEDSDDEAAEVTGSTTATEWGKKARRRQREVLKKLIDVEENRLAELQEDDEDKDIEEFLVKE